MGLHKGEGTELNTDFVGEVPEKSLITRLATCALKTSG
jgi:hypothetical protein